LEILSGGAEFSPRRIANKKIYSIFPRGYVERGIDRGSG
jgi:hypothetical protein